MTIMAVNNHCHRLGQLIAALRIAYPRDEIVDFADPFRAVQYSVSNNVDLVFADDGLKPFQTLEFAGMVTHFSKGAKVYVVTGELQYKDLDFMDLNVPLPGASVRAVSFQDLEHTVL